MNNDYKKLLVWEKSRVFVKEIYSLTANFPKTELYTLTSQINRAAISIPSNIAKWAGRNGKAEFKQFLFIAKGSCYEVETQLYITSDLWYIEKEKFEKLHWQLLEIIKMLQWLINSIST